MKTQFSSKKFLFSNSAKSISAEVSELEVNSLPSVFGIKSEKTKKVVYFCHEKTCRNVDNEVTHMIYQPLTPDPVMAGWTVTIFND